MRCTEVTDVRLQLSDGVSGVLPFFLRPLHAFLHRRDAVVRMIEPVLVKGAVERTGPQWRRTVSVPEGRRVRTSLRSFGYMFCRYWHAPSANSGRFAGGSGPSWDLDGLDSRDDKERPFLIDIFLKKTSLLFSFSFLSIEINREAFVGR